jgi:hypothetical protein
VAETVAIGLQVARDSVRPEGSIVAPREAGHRIAIRNPIFDTYGEPE